MLRPNPTVATRDPYALPDIGAAEGLEAIVLAQNEHPCAPSALMRQAVAGAMQQVKLYPDSDWTELRAAIAGVHALNPDNIVCGWRLSVQAQELVGLDSV